MASSTDTYFDSLNVVTLEEGDYAGVETADLIQDEGLFCNIWSVETLQEELHILGLGLPESPSLELLLLCASFLEGDAVCVAGLDSDHIALIRRLASSSPCWLLRAETDTACVAYRAPRHCVATLEKMQALGLKGQPVVAPVPLALEIQLLERTFNSVKNELPAVHP